MRIGEPRLKRPLDLLGAAVGLLVSWPLWLVVAGAIWLESGRPVFFVQERLGRHGRPFKAIKFRTMRPGSNPVQDAPAADPRVTRVGRLLRATALDELPQLVNILRGEMSFVGPRALYPVIEDAESARYRRIEEVPGFWLRSQVRPGLTGLAQLYAPKRASRRHKFRYDCLYVQRMSLWLDLQLIVRSLWVTLRGRWERRALD